MTKLHLIVDGDWAFSAPGRLLGRSPEGRGERIDLGRVLSFASDEAFGQRDVEAVYVARLNEGPKVESFYESLKRLGYDLDLLSRLYEHDWQRPKRKIVERLEKIAAQNDGDVLLVGHDFRDTGTSETQPGEFTKALQSIASGRRLQRRRQVGVMVLKDLPNSFSPSGPAKMFDLVDDVEAAPRILYSPRPTTAPAVLDPVAPPVDRSRSSSGRQRADETGILNMLGTRDAQAQQAREHLLRVVAEVAKVLAGDNVPAPVIHGDRVEVESHYIGAGNRRSAVLRKLEIGDDGMPKVVDTRTYDLQ